MRFKNKVVVIFGGNSGIGLASAQSFCKEGAKVVITGRNSETLAAAVEQLGGDTLGLTSDISNLADIDSVVASVKQRFGRIDVLFVNAGIGHFLPVEKTLESDWDRMLSINLKGPFFAIQKSLPLMSEGASIVVTSSIGHVMGLPGNSAYAASKAGLRALVRNVGVELVGRGIRVNCFSPGPVETPLLYRSGLSDAEVGRLREQMCSAVPMGRMGTQEEAASAVLFLASSESSFITGIDLFVDGGAVSFK